MNAHSFQNPGYDSTLQEFPTTSNFGPLEIHIEINDVADTVSKRKLSRSACCLELMEVWFLTYSDGNT